MGGRINTLSGVLHIPRLAKNLTSTGKKSDASVRTCLKRIPIGSFEEKWYY